MSVRNLGDVVQRSQATVSVVESSNVVDLARALKVNNADAAAVLTASGTLAGIATSYDIAKILGRGDNGSVSVTQAMTVHPTMLPPEETPANALRIMRHGGFRHLPVVDPSSGAVLGIIDVLHLAYDAISRLQASCSLVPTRRTFAFMRAARDTIEKPTLRTFLQSASFTALLPDHTALDACEAIVRNHVAAIIIVDPVGNLEGIFTCRDVASRVVAAGRNPAQTKLRDVMTARPDFALPDFTIVECLQRMQACGFRHLPVLDEQSRKVVGLVDVLQLAAESIAGLADGGSYALPHSSLSTRSGSTAQGGGVSAFFSSLFSSGFAQATPRDGPAGTKNGLKNRGGASESGESYEPASTLQRNSGVSATGPRAISTLSAADLARVRGATQLNSASVSEGPRPSPNTITFKFRDQNGEFRRLKVHTTPNRGCFDQFAIDVRLKYYSSSSGSDNAPLRIKYVDEDGDDVVISSDDELVACFAEGQDLNWRTVTLKVSEMQSRRSVHSEQSPMSSSPASVSSGPPSRYEHEGTPSTQSETNVDGQHCNETKSSESQLPSLNAPNAISVPTSASEAKAAEAHSLLMDQRVDEAIRKFDEAIALNAANARALAGRGAAKLIHGNPELAEVDYRKSLAIMSEQPSDAIDERTLEMCVVGLVESLVSLCRYEDAVEVSAKLDGRAGKTGCADALRDELDAASGAAFSALGNSEFAEAMALFSNAIRVEKAFIAVSDGKESASGSLYSGRAACYMKMDDLDMAIEDFEKAIQLEPENMAALKGLGKCYIEIGKNELAIGAYTRAIAVDRADEDAQQQLARLTPRQSDEHPADPNTIAKLGAMLGGMSIPSRARTPSNLGSSSQKATEDHLTKDMSNDSDKGVHNGKRKRKKLRSRP